MRESDKTKQDLSPEEIELARKRAKDIILESTFLLNGKDSLVVTDSKGRPMVIIGEMALEDTIFEGSQLAICRRLGKYADGLVLEEWFGFTRDSTIRIERVSILKMIYLEKTGLYQDRLVPVQPDRQTQASLDLLTAIWQDLTAVRPRPEINK